MNEFEIIERFFNPLGSSHIGEDAAIISPSSGYDIHVSVDTLAEGQHFFSNVEPKSLGHKALAVNLSDMAAMGASPCWALLSLSLPSINEKWLSDFSEGFFALADQFKVSLIGGDTIKAPLSITVTIIGESKQGKALYRHGAKIDDEIWVSGLLGLAALALKKERKTACDIPSDLLKICKKKLHWPEPRILLGKALQGLAHACIDLSDGLLADLSHLLKRSRCGATLWLDALPSHPFIKNNQSLQQDCLLSGGDDYELLFAAPKKFHRLVDELGRKLNVTLTCIGSIKSALELDVIDKAGNSISVSVQGFDHFRS